MLLERDRELDALATTLERARQGAGALVTVSGPIGIGRSALLEVTAERARTAGLTVLRARATPVERDLDLGVARQLLDGVAPVAGTGNPGPAGTAADDLHRRLDSVERAGPVLLVVDDVHWADRASLGWLTSVSLRVGWRPSVVLLSVLDGEIGSPAHELLSAATVRLPLRPLSARGCAALLHAAGGDRPTGAEVDALLAVTGGTPSAVAAVVVDRPAGEPGPTRAAALRSARPAALRTRIVAELRHRSEPLRRVLTALVVSGDDGDVDLLVQLTGLDAPDVHRALGECGELGLVDPRRPTVRRPVLGDVVSELATGGEREMHLRAAAVLDDRGAPAERIAPHLTGLSAPLPAWAVALLRGAALASAADGDPHTAVALARCALIGGAGDAGDRAEILLELAGLERGVQPGMAVRRVRRALPLLAGPAARADAVRRIPVFELEAAPTSSSRLLERTLDELAAVPGLERSASGREVVLALRARLHHVAKNDPERLRDLAARSEAIEELPLDTAAARELVAALLYSRVLAGCGDAAQTARVGRRILEREPASVDHVHSPLGHVVSALCLADALDELSPWLAIALVRARAAGTPVEQGVILAEQAAVEICSGRLVDAEKLVHEACALFDAPLADDPVLPAMVVAPLLLGLVDPGPAARLLERHGQREPAPAGLASLLSLLHARIAAEDGDPATALEHCRESGRRADRAGWRRPPISWRAPAIELLTRLGRAAEARELAEAELARARAWGAPTTLGRALRRLAALTGHPGDESLLREAVEVLGHSHDRLELARTLRALGEAVVARGDRSGFDHVLESERIVAGLGLPPDAADPTGGPGRPLAPVRLPAPVRGTGTGGRGDAGQDGGAGEDGGAGGDGTGPALRRLNASERRLARDVVAGRTNADIARELGVSVRAVEKRLTKIYRTLGIPGRGALGATLHGTG